LKNPGKDKELKKFKEGWERQGFNEFICNKVSIHRSIKDVRPKECKNLVYRKPLPTTSVIIVFHNEARCTLLRTIYSILETTPKILLEEIILVDDKLGNFYTTKF